MRFAQKLLLLFFFFCLPLYLVSCISSPIVEKEEVSRNLSASGIKDARQLYAFFESAAPEKCGAKEKALAKRLAAYYIAEAKTEGINSDCAFVQMCLETGFLTFGNLVTIEMHNYCGLGAIDRDHRGEVFASEQEGVRAHIQHLHAYATSEDVLLKNPLIDNRYKWVKPRGKAKSVFELAGTWAMDKDYGKKLDALLERLEAF